jgi:hypothetical protein
VKLAGLWPYEELILRAILDVLRSSKVELRALLSAEIERPCRCRQDSEAAEELIRILDELHQQIPQCERTVNFSRENITLNRKEPM